MFWRPIISLLTLILLGIHFFPRNSQMDSWNCHSAWNEVTLKFAISEVQNRENPQLKSSLLLGRISAADTFFSPDDVGFYVNKSQREERMPALISQLWLLTSGTDTGRLLLSKLKNAFDLFEYQEERNAIYLCGRISCPSFLSGKDKTVFSGMRKQHSKTNQLRKMSCLFYYNLFIYFLKVMSLLFWIEAFNRKQGGSCGKVLLLPGLACLTDLLSRQNMTVSNETPDRTDRSVKQGKESPMSVSGNSHWRFSQNILSVQNNVLSVQRLKN